MMRVLYTSTTGMRQNELGLDVISNNLSNANTTGFKRSQVLFSDLMYQTQSLASANTNPKQVGLGVGTAAINPVFTQGGMQRTNNQLDMMIEGAGFFIVNGPAAGNNDLYYTRAGHFGLDGGDLVAADGTISPGPSHLVDMRTGHIVQGWLANAAGNIVPTVTAEDIVFATDIATNPPAATTAVALGGNLSADNALRYSLLTSPVMPVMRDWSGTPLAGVAGSYQMVSAADGSYQMTFTAETVLDPASVAIAAAGTATVGSVGTYTVDTTAGDGSAIVTFTDGVNPPVVTLFPAGTVIANSTVAGLIPGMTLDFGPAIAGITTVTPDITYPAAAAGTLVTGIANAAIIPGMTLTPGPDLAGTTTIDTTGAATTLTSAVTTPVAAVAGSWGQPAAGDAGIYRLESNADGSYRLTFVANDNQPRIESSDVVTNTTGSATAGRMGNYIVVTRADGSATVTLDDNVNGPEVTNYDPGTVTAYATVDGLIPGVGLVFGANIAGTTRISIPGTESFGMAGSLVAGTVDRDVIPGITMTMGASLDGTTVIDTTGGAVAGEELVTSYIYDANGVPLQLLTDFNRLEQNKWSYHMFVAGEETATAQGTAGGETFTLNYAPEPGSVEIFVGNNTTPLDQSKFAIVGNQLVPVDTNGDLVNDSPLMTAGQAVRIRYRLAESGSANNSGTVEFDSLGLLSAINGIPPATFAATFSGLSITTDFAELVQIHGDSGADTVAADGNPEGSLTGLSVDPTGKIIAGYTNGRTIALAQVALATFVNPQGLHQSGESYFTPTANSGNAVVTPPGGDPYGVILSAAGFVRGSALEAANVDMAVEMIDMLAFQRAYQINSRGISTASEMIRTAIDMKR